MQRFLTGLLLSSCITTAACSGLLYHPDRILRDDIRAQAKIQPEDVSFSSRNGTSLHGWHFRQKKRKPKGRIVFFHGNAENVSTHFASLYWILEKGYDYFIFDYRGYGLSHGNPSPQGTIDDGIGALCWTATQKPYIPLIVFGQSLGGTVALSTLAETRERIPVAAMIVDSAFHSYKSAARSALASHWLTWPLQPLGYLLFSDRYAPKNSMDLLPEVPLLVVHGTNDRIVKFQLGKKLFDDAPEPKTFLEIPGGHHTDAMWREEGKYRKTVLNYINRAVTEQPRLDPAQKMAIEDYCRKKEGATPEE